MEGPIPNTVFNAFHTIDRELFSILTICLCQSPLESMHVIALWLWLERKISARGFIHRMLLFPHTIIFALLEETVRCLDFLQGRPILEDELPLLAMLLEKNISLQFFQQHFFAVAEGIHDMLVNVCGRAFNDITPKAVMVNTAPTLSENDRRTVFMTFSWGKVVPELTLVDYIIATHGDNMESMLMQQVEVNAQPMYAKVVFRNKTTVENILQADFHSLINRISSEDACFFLSGDFS